MWTTAPGFWRSDKGRRWPRPTPQCSRCSGRWRRSGTPHQSLQIRGLVFALQHGENLLIFIKYVTTAYFYRKASTSHPGTWGISSSRQSGCPRWCTGPAPSPGRREGCHRRRRKQSKGWRRHLEDTESDGAQCQDPLHCTVFGGWISSKKGQLFMWLVGEDLNDVAQQFICTKGEVSPWETYI